LGLINPCGDLRIDFVECTFEWGIDGAETGKGSGEAWAQQAVVQLGEEQGSTEAKRSDAIAKTVW
jgi:hypothetical protein